MVEATFCPLTIIASDGTPPDVINRDVLVGAICCLEECVKHNITIRLSNSVLKEIYNLFPWTNNGDEILRQWVEKWTISFLYPLKKAANPEDFAENLDARHNFEFYCDISGYEEMKFCWADFLSLWQGGIKINNKFGNTIICDESKCFDNEDQKQSAVCVKYCSSGTGKDSWVKVKYPMYLKYPNTLPCGEYPFVPPPNWCQSGFELKGNKNGFLDRDGNEWQWGTHHGPHWDVQIARGGGHIRVTPEGRII